MGKGGCVDQGKGPELKSSWRRLKNRRAPEDAAWSQDGLAGGRTNRAVKKGPSESQPEETKNNWRGSGKKKFL